jgi:hypothetical protein
MKRGMQMKMMRMMRMDVRSEMEMMQMTRQ